MVDINNINEFIRSKDDHNLLLIVENEKLDFFNSKKIYDYCFEKALSGDSDLLITILNNQNILEQLDKESIIDDLSSVDIMDNRLQQLTKDLENEVDKFSLLEKNLLDDSDHDPIVIDEYDNKYFDNNEDEDDY